MVTTNTYPGNGAGVGSVAGVAEACSDLWSYRYVS